MVLTFLMWFLVSYHSACTFSLRWTMLSFVKDVCTSSSFCWELSSPPLLHLVNFILPSDLNLNILGEAFSDSSKLDRSSPIFMKSIFLATVYWWVNVFQSITIAWLMSQSQNNQKTYSTEKNLKDYYVAYMVGIRRLFSTMRKTQAAFWLYNPAC